MSKHETILLSLINTHMKTQSASFCHRGCFAAAALFVHVHFLHMQSLIFPLGRCRGAVFSPVAMVNYVICIPLIRRFGSSRTRCTRGNVDFAD